MIVSILMGLGVALFGFVFQTALGGVNRKIVGRLVMVGSLILV
jgi:NADH-quinone oxidoreductase subunit H